MITYTIIYQKNKQSKNRYVIYQIQTWLELGFLANL